MGTITRWWFAPSAGVLWLLATAGCASRPPPDSSSTLKAWESQRAAAKPPPAAAADAPDTPVAPPPPAPRLADRVLEGPGVSITIQPDSLVRIAVKEDPGLDGSYPVNEMGAVQLGYVGPVFLLNLDEKRAEAKIADVLKSRDFRNATVSVRILRASYDTVRVAGAVNRAGLIQIGSGDRILLNDALLRAGGLKASARSVKVRVVREGMRFAVAFDLEGEEYALVDAEARPIVPDVWLRNNDLVYVYGVSSEKAPERDVAVRILLLGEVKQPGYFTFAGWEPCTMMNLMFKVGGLPPFANKRAVKVIRRNEAGEEIEIEVNVESIMQEGSPDKDVELRNGDRVVVPERRITIF